MTQLNIRISDDLLDRARVVADAYDTTVTQLVIDSLALECHRRTVRLPRGQLERPVIIAALDIPCPNDKVISIHGQHVGTAAGTAIVDVRNVADISTIPVASYRATLRNVQFICTEAQFDSLMAHISAIIERHAL